MRRRVRKKKKKNFTSLHFTRKKTVPTANTTFVREDGTSVLAKYQNGCGCALRSAAEKLFFSGDPCVSWEVKPVKAGRRGACGPLR